jgi:membrane associated rhomboid family serine protease
VGRLLVLVGSMFLHGSFDHILGYMLFLWIFGRAVEDALGPRVYLGAYLLCGIAATLLHHIMTQFFAPDSMMIPSFGASGAIAGVMGLFAPRFYRTPVRVFYLLPTALIGGGIAFGVLYLIAALITGDPIASAFLAFAGVLAGLYFFGKTWAWGAFNAPAAFFLGFYVGWFDLRPAIYSLASGGDVGDGVAHWAHIGGFLFGVMYALLIGAQNEGKQEFMLEDAEKAFNLGDMAGAVSYSQSVLEREPGNPGAYEVLSKAYMKQNSENDALDNFELAIENYLRIGERGKAAACYLMALEKYPRFILQTPTQLAIGNQMAKNYSFKEAAETLVKIPYTFPDASEGEVALLRAAQIYLQYLNQPQTTVQLLQFFLQKYPESQWLPQVERAWKMAHHQLMAPPEPEVVEEPVETVPEEPAKVRPQAVAPVLELEDNSAAGASQGYTTQSAPPSARTQQMPPRPPGR